MIYNFNLGIGWASSGVEYAQAYRASMLRRVGLEARFIFTDMFPSENLEHMTSNLGFLDEEVIWLYTFFTDTRISPVTYTLAELEKTLGDRPYTVSRNGRIVRYLFEEEGDFYTAYLVNETEDLVHRVELVVGGNLIRKDYYTYTHIYSEYYAPLDHQAHLYQRRFFHEDGRVAYDEIIDGNRVMYRFPDRVLGSKEELVGYLVDRLQLTAEDIVIIDRATDIGQAILMHAGDASVGVVIHADHYSVGATTEENILWNNFYEYTFSQWRHISFFVTATEEQNQLLRKQFRSYVGGEPKVITIPVGSLPELKIPVTPRRRHSLITASRLATEKHVDWIIEAVVQAREKVPDLTLDIYGKGGEEEKLRSMIKTHGAEEYIRMMGQQDLTEVYQNYEGYISASQSEGFGLTLLEAVGAGLPVIGFDVPYGNQTFIDPDENGYRIEVEESMDNKERVEKLQECVERLFLETDLGAFQEHSYRKATSYLTVEVEKKWKEEMEQIRKEKIRSC